MGISFKGTVAKNLEFVPDSEYKDKKPTTGKLWVETATSAGTCAIQCYKDVQCTSFFINSKNKNTKNCYGYSGDIETGTFGLVETVGWTYFRDPSVKFGKASTISYQDCGTTDAAIFTTTPKISGNAGDIESRTDMVGWLGG